MPIMAIKPSSQILNKVQQSSLTVIDSRAAKEQTDRNPILFTGTVMPKS